MSIWKSNTELPKEDSECVFINKTSSSFEESICIGYFTDGEFVSDEYVSHENIEKWAYAEDLISSSFKEPVLWSVRHKGSDYVDHEYVFETAEEAEEHAANWKESYKHEREVVALYD